MRVSFTLGNSAVPLAGQHGTGLCPNSARIIHILRTCSLILFLGENCAGNSDPLVTVHCGMYLLLGIGFSLVDHESLEDS